MINAEAFDHLKIWNPLHAWNPSIWCLPTAIKPYKDVIWAMGWPTILETHSVFFMKDIDFLGAIGLSPNCTFVGGVLIDQTQLFQNLFAHFYVLGWRKKIVIFIPSTMCLKKLFLGYR